MSMQDSRQEDKLVQGCIREDRQSQELLYRRYAKEMYGICKGYAKDADAAKDILQEGFIKVFKNIRQYKGGVLGGWIRRIMVNTAIDYYRKQIRERAVTEVREQDVQYDNNILEQLQMEDLQRLFQRLPDGARLVFNLYAVEGYAHKEIAAQLGISEGTSKSQYNRARMLLKEMILKTDHSNTLKIV